MIKVISVTGWWIFFLSVFSKHIRPSVFAAFCILRLWGIFQLPWVLVSEHQAAPCSSAGTEEPPPHNGAALPAALWKLLSIATWKTAFKAPLPLYYKPGGRSHPGSGREVRTRRFCYQHSPRVAAGGGWPALLLPFSVWATASQSKGLCPARCSPAPFHSWGQLACLD